MAWLLWRLSILEILQCFLRIVVTILRTFQKTLAKNLNLFVEAPLRCLKILVALKSKLIQTWDIFHRFILPFPLPSPWKNWSCRIEVMRLRYLCFGMLWDISLADTIRQHLCVLNFRVVNAAVGQSPGSLLIR